MKLETTDEESPAHERTQAIETCPRCGTDHGERTFKRLVRPVRFGGATFDYWWPCETTGEPVLAEIPPPEDQ